MLSSRASFELCDILNEIPNGKYDIITSNPPYIKTEVIYGLQTEVKDFEPHLALDGGEDGLIFYRRICEIAPNLLTKNGILVFHITSTYFYRIFNRDIKFKSHEKALVK